MMESVISESKADENDVIPAASNIGGRGAEVVLIQRHQSIERNVIAALCNAAQEPGLGDNFSLVRNAKRGFNRKLKMEDLRLPHIYDIVMALTQDNETQAVNPGAMCVFMGGFEAEAEEFKRMRPKFFFINCDIFIGSTQQGGGHRAQLIVPVIFRGGHYYIISGKENIPLYRIHHPEHFFFSTEGRSALIRLLTQWYCRNRGDAVDLVFTREGKLLLYCLPKVSGSCGFPNEMWDDLTEEQIKPNIPFQLVHEPSVPTDQNYSVQLVRLNDSNNIIDINISEMS